MPELPESFDRNKLLATLAQGDLDLLGPHLQLIDLTLGDVLYKPNEPIEYAYFLTSGICSTIAESRHGIRIETGITGREGFLGLPIVLYAESAPSKVMMQANGQALRISRAELMSAMQQSQKLAATLLRFVHAFHVQVSQTALANGTYPLIQRLARWLVMCQDRVDAYEFPLTHQFLSYMLAVRRPGITDALSSLQGRKTIRALRGRIIILDRPALLDIAGSTYGVPEREYNRLFSQA